MDQLIQLFNNKPYLAWYLKNKEQLSERSMLEHILNYGNWDDYILAEKAFGIEKAKMLYESLKNKQRVNLQDKTINYFDQYYQKYA